MTAHDSTVPTLLVAIDISKHRHEVLIGIPGKKRRRRLTIENSLEDFQRLSRLLQLARADAARGFVDAILDDGGAQKEQRHFQRGEDQQEERRGDQGEFNRRSALARTMKPRDAVPDPGRC